MGLCNPGIDSVKTFDPNHLYSIAALDKSDYEYFYDHIPAGTNIEFNVGCPNADTVYPDYAILRDFVTKFGIVSVKFPPMKNEAVKVMGPAFAAGVRDFHLCNTLPSPHGGISGKQLRRHSLHMTEWVHTYMPQVHITGGGGIYLPRHIKWYQKAGADSYSLGSIWFTPWMIPAVVKTIRNIA